MRSKCVGYVTGWALRSDRKFFSSDRAGLRSEATANFDGAVAFDETEAPEFVRQKADSRAVGTDHFRQSLVADLSDDFLGLGVEPFLAGVEGLGYVTE
jgi:hypothetical protein